MLLDLETLRRIKEGSVTLQFRRWKRPTVKAGGTLLTAVGQLAIDAVEEVDAEEIAESEAIAAGFESVSALRELLDRKEGPAYRVSLRYAGEDPRIALRRSIPDAGELETIVKRLQKWDRSSPVGPWTRPALDVIRDMPETRAVELAESIGLERDRFKTNVRKLKGLGLTESLEIGYRLSPRGEHVLATLEGEG